MSDIKLITWNIHGGALQHRMATFEDIQQNTNLLGSVIRSFQADVIFLQEVHFIEAFNQLQLIGEQAGYPHSLSLELDSSHIFHHPSARIGIGILSKYPLTRPAHFFFTNPSLTGRQQNGEWWETHQKGVLSGSLLIDGVELTLACLHLLPMHKFIGDLGGSAIYKAYLKTIGLELGRHFSALQAPLILGGDFNMNDVGPLIRVSAPALQLEDIQFKDYTIETYNFDHILVDRSLEVLEFAVLKEHVYSDHYPCYARIKL